MKRLLFSFFAVITALFPLFFDGCVDSANTRYTRVGDRIGFPSNAVFWDYSADTIVTVPDNCCKIVCYVDSSGCTNCRVKFAAWTRFSERIEEKYGNSVMCLFVFNPRSGFDTYGYFRTRRFYIPVFTDTFGLFGKMNKIKPSANLSTQTMLLSAEDSIILIGNPIISSAMEQSYLSALDSMTD